MGKQIVVRKKSVPEVEDESRLAEFAFENADGAGDELDLDFGVLVKPLVDAVIEEAQGLVAEFAVERANAAGASGSEVGFALPFSVALLGSDAKGLDFLFPRNLVHFFDQADGIQLGISGLVGLNGDDLGRPEAW